MRRPAVSSAAAEPRGDEHRAELHARVYCGLALGESARERPLRSRARTASGYSVNAYSCPTAATKIRPLATIGVMKRSVADIASPGPPPANTTAPVSPS